MNSFPLGLIVFCAALFCFSPNTSSAKKLSRCDLAKELFFKFKFAKRLIPSLICLAEFGSRLNTSAVSEVKEDGSRAHGIFQIKDQDYCSVDADVRSECKVECEKLRDRKLDDDIRCVRQILSKHGLSYWEEWVKNCRGKYLMHFIHACFI
ncbi:lysozyme precursor-like protein [Dinothrombium tinctorium]|uniref:lysozyme n=1 Tax=Dinothrombium tinctorium TaxID=1965070 RepID=A0A443QLG5_9ACAR|nr:lysozyme precursor-like protein [Dinothrombium tinctorium]